jgi:UDP-2-acetamido-2,6-beta-L-arabino-hexul-4-ose reductase
MDEYYSGNTGLTDRIVNTLIDTNKKTPILLSSSIQATLDNDYGKSKKQAEDLIIKYSESGASVCIYRMHNVFGKWCKPNYNSVVATFCHNIANDLEVVIHNKETEIELVYIDDVIDEFLVFYESVSVDEKIKHVEKRYRTTLQELYERIVCFNRTIQTPNIPNLQDPFGSKLYSTFLSYLPAEKLNNIFDVKTDNRGSLFEIIKSNEFGQIFVSKTNAGITRGNHYHQSKNERFMVIKGKALIQLRDLSSGEVLEFEVDGDMPRSVIIPPGKTHNIKNIGKDELITIFWANEVFNSQKPDTYFEEV